MSSLLEKFQKNSLRIGLFVNDKGNEYFFVSVGRNVMGQIVYNGFLEWDNRKGEFQSHITWHSNGYEHHRFGVNKLQQKQRQKPDDNLSESSGVLCTSIRRGDAKFIQVVPPNSIFTHKFIV